MKTQPRYSILIVDDEKNAREFLKKLILRHFENSCNEIFTSGNLTKASEVLFHNKIDLIFLDIRLGEENGFDLLYNFRNRDFDVVFTTAHKEYAIKAIKAAAFDYLLKPISHIDLMEVFRKINQKRTQDKLVNSINQLNSKLHPFVNEFNKIALPTQEGIEFFPLIDICYVKASGSYSEVAFSDKSISITSKTLKYFEDRLPEKVFFRCHKSFLVNLNHIESYSDKEKLITLSNGSEIPVSTRKKEAFINEISR